MKIYDIVIIGAGPGGIFAAYELVKTDPDLSVAVIEAGYELNRRKCPIDGNKVKECIRCRRCSIMNGFCDTLQNHTFLRLGRMRSP